MYISGLLIALTTIATRAHCAVSTCIFQRRSNRVIVIVIIIIFIVVCEVERDALLDRRLASKRRRRRGRGQQAVGGAQHADPGRRRSDLRRRHQHLVCLRAAAVVAPAPFHVHTSAQLHNKSTNAIAHLRCTTGLSKQEANMYKGQVNMYSVSS